MEDVEHGGTPDRMNELDEIHGFDDFGIVFVESKERSLVFLENWDTFLDNSSGDLHSSSKTGVDDSDSFLESGSCALFSEMEFGIEAAILDSWIHEMDEIDCCFHLDMASCACHDHFLFYH